MLDEINVLVVDDERPLRQLYVKWLEMAGATVRTAANGKEAKNEWDTSLDAVLLDRRMPELTGDELLSELTNEQRNCSIIMISAVTPDFDIIEMGFDEYLTKPIEKDELTDIVSRLSRISAYDDIVGDYLTMVSKQQTLEAKKSPSTLENNTEYNELVSQIEESRNQLSDAVTGDIFTEILLQETGDDLTFIIEYKPDSWDYRYMTGGIGYSFASEDTDLNSLINIFRKENQKNTQIKNTLDLDDYYCSLHLFDALVLIHLYKQTGNGVICAFEPGVAPNITDFVSFIRPYLNHPNELPA